MSKLISLLFIISIINNNKIIGQELMINPSFEEYTKLVYNGGKEFCAKGWIISNDCSVDYYSEKFPIEIYGKRCWVPENVFGYHPSYEGLAYIGLCLFSWSGEMEHISGTLKEPLKKDSLYRICFHIRYAGDSVWIYSKSLEILLTKESKLLWWDTRYQFLFDNSKQLKASLKIDIEKAYLTREWIECTAIYKAQGGEKYVTFGLFYQNKNFISLCNEYIEDYNNSFEKQKEFINANKSNPIFVNKCFIPNIKNRKNVYAYYFLDAVSVTPLKNEAKEFTYPIGK